MSVTDRQESATFYDDSARDQINDPDFAFTIGAFLFYPNKSHLLKIETGNATRLRRKECALLRYLCLAGDAGASKEAIKVDVFGYKAETKTNTVVSHVCFLRERLEERAHNPEAYLISTPSGFKVRVTSVGIKPTPVI